MTENYMLKIIVKNNVADAKMTQVKNQLSTLLNA